MRCFTRRIGGGRTGRFGGLALGVLVGTGCSGSGTDKRPSDPSTTTSDPTTPTPTTCAVNITTTVPDPDAIDADYRAPIEFHLDGPDPTATVSMPIAGTTTTRDDGETIVFTPNTPLAPATAYEATLSYCRGDVPLAFSTSTLGEPLTDGPAATIGRTYAVDLADARFLASDAIASLVAGVFTEELLVGVVAAADDQITLRVALPAEGAQDLCFRTLDLPAGDLSEAPYFDVVGSDVAFDAYAGVVRMADFRLAGTFFADATAIGGATLATTIDAADLVDVMGVLDVGALCDLAEGFGAPCGPCPSGTGDSCVRVEVDQIEAAEVPGLALVEVEVPDQGPDCPG